MSYTPVREAFLRLQSEGLLRQVPGVGFFVEKLSFHEIMHIFQVRECIELYVMNAVFDSLNNSHFDKIQQLIEEQRNALKNGDMRAFMLADTEFHNVPIELSENKYFYDLVRNVRERFLLCSNQVARDRNDNAIIEHELILDSMKKGNKQETIELLKKHILAAKERIRDGYMLYVKGV
jgi:DNA-binding GntR family transcriptional regulator